MLLLGRLPVDAGAELQDLQSFPVRLGQRQVMRSRAQERESLPQRARSGAHQVDHKDGDHECRGEGEPPAQSVTPPWILHHVVELQRSVFN